MGQDNTRGGTDRPLRGPDRSIGGADRPTGDQNGLDARVRELEAHVHRLDQTLGMAILSFQRLIEALEQATDDESDEGIGYRQNARRIVQETLASMRQAGAKR